MRNASNVFHGLAQVQQLAFGGGGECTGIQIADDGTKVMRTDTGNAYLRGPSDSQWTQLIKFGGNVLQANGQYNYGSGGTFEAAIAATNSNHILVRAMGNHYRSTDKGVTFSKLSHLAGNAGEDSNVGQQRLYGRRTMFDPAGTAVIVTTDQTGTTGGFYYSTNSGSTFTKSASVPAPTSTLPMMIAFDRSSSVVSGKTQTVYVWSPGNGIYRSTTGCDGTFSLIGSSNFTGITAMEASGAKLWVCGSAYDIGDLKSWNGTIWTTATASGPTNVQAVSIAIDPTTSGGTTHIVAITNYGGYSASSDNGATWTLENAGNKAPMLRDATASEVPWHATSTLEATFLVITGLVFDPATAGTLWGAGGVGSWTLASAPLTQGATKTWVDKSRGIENMGTWEIQVTPSYVLIATQDRAVQVSAKSRVLLYPRTTVLDIGGINQCESIDYAADDENYIVAITNAGGFVYVSRDGGATWTATTTVPPNIPGIVYAGNVAVGNAGNFVYLPSNNSRPYYTADHGATWTECNFGGGHMPAGVLLHWAYFYRRRCVVSDKLGNIYLYAAGGGNDTSNDAAYIGVWKSTDGGANFTRQSSSVITSTSYDGANGKLIAVPARAGHLFWATGNIGSANDDTAANVQLKFSANGGATWSDAGIYEAEAIAVSAAAPGCSYNTLHVRGYSAVGDKTTFGTFRCTNFNPANPAGATWVKLYDWPLGCYDVTFSMAGDPTQWDRFYEGKWGGPTYVVGYLDTAHMA